MGKKKSNLVVNLSDDEEDVKKVEKVENNDIEDNNDEDKKEDEGEEEDEDENSGDEKKESKGKMIQRHKLEVKKLQQQIDKLNHAIPKKDKKAKQDLLVKTKKMEHELNMKHQEELDGFEKTQPNISESLNQLLINSKPNAPSKAYLKKAKKLEEEEQRIKQLEEDRKNFVSKGVIEFNDFMTKLKPLKKSIKMINPDGDCLYSAITNQLLINKIISEEESKKYPRTLRTIAADYIKANRDEFLPYISSEEDYTDSEDPISDYCEEQVLQVGKWGGHIELKALSESLKKVIVIFNAYSNDITIGEEFQNDKEEKLYLSYHRHAFTLGEHYNSVIPSSE
ncbi:hypothetical protein DICPUDRAFT_158319 [Dictyostelium purpureum]|uniref:OTU domain-containing protein n=1 Tax=Dictyostelium purpureum TaxID=5786 RepID=F1A1B3_DICPU|nr:uncharacterized protein DICPUDRAFT_158319 [Dictyostelium purpureum]EGC30015.1 hypothetical protein DICPUDRAFT_158319 [Dictyostelium purpureum]|eukprot:XP_003293461.1 hypothetical protein DICPUDRAFT_158319 [Dictyostelium purpureum]